MPSTTVTFVKGKRGADNAVVDDYRYTKNGSHNGKTYYRCIDRSCIARITLNEDKSLSSPVPTHSHGHQEADIAVIRAKNQIKTLASTSDMTTKDIVATSLQELDFECMAKLNCRLSSLSKMSRLSRQKSSQHPPPPTSLEHLIIPLTIRQILVIRICCCGIRVGLMNIDVL